MSRNEGGSRSGYLVCAGEETASTAALLEDYARHGLRTMVVAARSVDEDEYAEWAGKMREARVALQDRDVSGSLLSARHLSVPAFDFGQAKK